MTNVPDIFKAHANSFGEMMIGGSGTLSLKVPEYQRPYDWDNRNVQRMLHDCLNGLKGVATPSPSNQYTFLGAIILASDDDREATFDGESKQIVDGQQRLTTLLLLSCAVFEAIRNHRGELSNVPHAKTRGWLEAECDEQLNRLYGCTTGRRQSLSTTSPFPRMVRNIDNRGHTPTTSEYRSSIAVFLKDFERYCADPQSRFAPDIGNQDRHLWNIYRYIRERVEKYVYSGHTETAGQDDDFDPSILERAEFNRKGSRDLFVKLSDIGSQSDADQIVSHLTANQDIEGLVRLLLFASYMVQCVVLTVVEAPSEDIAFDIFDALNTTGEPLTALETLKPHVVRLERDHGEGFSGSRSENWWAVLEENVIEPNTQPDRRQRVTKELVTGFAVYYVGDKIGSDLNVQRNTLRNYFIRARNRGDDTARNFVQSLAQMSRFRRQYWDKASIDALDGPIVDKQHYDELKFCLRFIADCNTSTTIPIIARYWIHFGESDSEPELLEAVKAITSFLALRRAMTGGTAGIDSEFRRVMARGDESVSIPLAIGEELNNRILTIDELKNRLLRRLSSGRYRASNKQEWLERARGVSLVNQASRVVFRFLICAATHNSMPDSSNPGLLRRDGVIPSDELNFFNHATWVGPKYDTIEHVAPVSDSAGGWDGSIYRQLDTREKIGNVVLLPEKENQSIGNASWEKKKLFYRALIAKETSEREKAIALAQQQGVVFGRRTLALIENQSRLHMLDAVADVEHWSAQLIHNRTENLLELAWDQIAPWLFE